MPKNRRHTFDFTEVYAYSRFLESIRQLGRSRNAVYEVCIHNCGDYILGSQINSMSVIYPVARKRGPQS